MKKVIVTVAPTGAWPTKEHNPNVPLTPKEIAEDVYDCWKAGAAVAHIHTRDDNGKPTMSPEKFRETVELVKSKCDIVLNLTTSGDLHSSDETRMAHIIELKPEMASYDAGSMNWQNNSVFVNTPQFLEKLAKTMLENNVKPELEIFDAGMIYNTLYYMKKGLIASPAHYQFVLGAPGGTAATVENLVYLRSLLPKDSTWSAFGLGKDHLPILLAAIAMGGHVRVGMEDNIYYAKDRLVKSNSEFVERAVRIIREANKEVATPENARMILKLNQRNN